MSDDFRASLERDALSLRPIRGLSGVVDYFKGMGYEVSAYIFSNLKGPEAFLVLKTGSKRYIVDCSYRPPHPTPVEVWRRNGGKITLYHSLTD